METHSLFGRTSPKRIPLFPTTANDRPTVQSNQINSKTAVRFNQDNENDGDDMRVDSPASNFPTAASWFAVVKLDEASNKQYNIIGTNSLNDDRFVAGTWSESRPSSFLNYRATLSTYYSSFPSTGVHLFAYESDASVFRISLNGTELATSGAGYSPGNGTSWQIGNRYNNGQALNGHIGELLVMNTVLSNTGRQAMEGYLAHKWGLAGSLPNSHLFKSSNTSSAAPVISSSATASGTVGSAFSYIIVTNVANPSYEAANLPPGLTCNLGTGAITGSPLAGGTYTVTLSAQSTSSSESATKVLTITIPVSAPLLAVEAPGNLVMNGAKLKGAVTNTVGATPPSRYTGGMTMPAPRLQIRLGIGTATLTWAARVRLLWLTMSRACPVEPHTTMSLKESMQQVETVEPPGPVSKASPPPPPRSVPPF